MNQCAKLTQNKQNQHFIWGVIIERKILLVSKIKSVWRSFLFQMSSGRANINMTCCSLWGKVRVEQIFCPISMVSQVSDSLEIFYFILSLIMSRHRQAYFNLLDMKFFVPFLFKAEKNIGDHQQFCFWKCSQFNYIQKFLGNSGTVVDLSCYISRTDVCWRKYKFNFREHVGCCRRSNIKTCLSLKLNFQLIFYPNSSLKLND